MRQNARELGPLEGLSMPAPALRCRAHVRAPERGHQKLLGDSKRRDSGSSQD